jgi:RNA polymerase sigma factor (sigma-70 family)
MAADSPGAKEHPMAVLTISSLTLSGSKSAFARRARSHREQTLLAAAKCGDRAAFDELLQPLAKRTFQIVYRITRNREDAQDALQDSFLRALRHIEAFESRSSFSSWFTSIAINSALMILRKRRNSSEIPVDGSGNSDAIDRHWEAADRAPNPEKHCLQKERERILRRAIRALRPSLRGVVAMQQLQEHSMKETARMIGITVAAAKARLFHARVELRKDSALKTIARTTPNSERN